MVDAIAKWKENSTKLEFMDDFINEERVGTLFAKRFEELSKSMFRPIIFVLLIEKDLAKTILYTFFVQGNGLQHGQRLKSTNRVNSR